MMQLEIMKFFNKHIMLIIAWIVLLISLIVLMFNNYFYKVREISFSEATYLINKKNAMIVDIRKYDQFRDGHIANAINLTASDIKKGHLVDLKKHKTQTIILACTNGINSYKLAENLNKLGFENVAILKGGILAWNSEKLPLVQGK